MVWWAVFRKIRKAIFVFIAITSLLWAVLLSVYLVQEWSHFSLFQRSIVISMIVVNAITAILQYLMIVVVFRIWMEFFRTFFLVSVHAASSVLFTLFGTDFSCAVWSSESMCQDAFIVILVGAWISTGLLMGYILYLLVMSQVPRPIPKITPNLLISTPHSSRPPSVTSVNSATRLLDVEKQGVADSPQPGEKEETELSPQAHTIPKKLFVVNGMPSPVSPAHGSPQSRATSYGSVTSPGPSRSPARPSGLRNSLLNGLTTFAQKRFSRPEPLPLANPFHEPLHRDGTPDSVLSSLTFSSSTSNQVGGSSSPHGYRPVGDDYYYPISLSGESEFTVPEDRSNHEPDSPSTIYSLYTAEYRNPDLSTYPLPLKPLSPAHPVQSATLSAPPRHHTQTPGSIHSISPSLHFHEQPPNRTPPPPEPAHLRAYSDPVVYRPYTASPRLIHEPLYHPASLQSSRPPPPRSASVRRHGSIGYAQGSFASSRNAHFQVAMGRPPPRTVNTSPTISRTEWKQLVMSAAGSRA